MRKATQTQTAAAVAKLAKPAKPAKAAKPAAVEADEGEADEGEADEGETQSQWARELARAHAGEGNACRRWHSLAVALATVAPAAGKPAVRLSFAKANELSGLRRGASGDAVASWRLSVQRMRATYGGADALAAAFGFAVSVDAESQALVIEHA